MVLYSNPLLKTLQCSDGATFNSFFNANDTFEEKPKGRRKNRTVKDMDKQMKLMKVTMFLSFTIFNPK